MLIIFINYSFQRKVLELEEVNMKPVFSVGNVHYAWIKHSNIYGKPYLEIRNT